LGLIYEEKFKEYDFSHSKLEQANYCQNKPEEKLILPAMALGKISSDYNPPEQQSSITATYPN